MLELDSYTVRAICLRLNNGDMASMLRTCQHINLVCNSNELWASKLLSEFGISPSDYSQSAQRVYQRLLTLPHDTRFAYHAANHAAKTNDVVAIKYLSSFDILPNHESIGVTARNGHLRILKFLVSCNTLPDLYVANEAASGGHIDVLQYFATLSPPVRPDSNGADWAAMGGKIQCIKYLASLNPPILPTSQGANSVVMNFHLDITETVRKERIETIKFLASLNILPNRDTVQWVTHSETKEFLLSLDLPEPDMAGWQ